MRRAAAPWTGIAAAFAVWVAVTAASTQARVGPEQEGLVVPRPGREATARAARVSQPQPGGYVGADVCLECHEEQADINRTAHGRAANPRTPAAAQGCETCHGPGQAHVDDDDGGHILRFGDTKVDPRTGNEACLSCHTKGPHALWEGSAHDARNMSCASCHSAHSPASHEYQLKTETQTTLCASCHRQQAAKMRRSSHMPITEGKMECSSCHNPHGSTNVKLLRVGNWLNESCVSCHT